MKPAVIAFCGPPGAGKSSLVHAIAAQRPGCLTVNYDDFPNPTAQSFSAIKTWFERSADPNEFEVPQLEAHMEKLIATGATALSPPIVLFETPFGRIHRKTGRFIDFAVWIDIPLEIALARQVQAICRQKRNPPMPEYQAFVSGLDRFLQYYTEVVVHMYKRQAIDVRAGSDLIVDGLKATSELATAIIESVPAFIDHCRA